MVIGIIISDSSAFSEGEFASGPNSMLQIIDIEPEVVYYFGREEWVIKVTIINNGAERSNGRGIQAITKVRSEDDIIFTELLEIMAPKLSPGETFISLLHINLSVQNPEPVNAFTISIESAQDIIIGMEKKFTASK